MATPEERLALHIRSLIDRQKSFENRFTDLEQATFGQETRAQPAAYGNAFFTQPVHHTLKAGEKLSDDELPEGAPPGTRFIRAYRILPDSAFSYANNPVLEERPLYVLVPKNFGVPAKDDIILVSLVGTFLDEENETESTLFVLSGGGSSTTLGKVASKVANVSSVTSGDNSTNYPLSDEDPVSPQIYSVRLFGSGWAAAETATEEVVQIAIHKDSEIPRDSWVLVYKGGSAVCTDENGKEHEISNFMLAPTWL
jgi:hypothetical protein